MPSKSENITIRYAQKIAVVNNGGFVLEYKIARSRDGQNSDVTEYSPNVALGGQHTQNLEDLGQSLSVGDEVFPIVHAWLGNTENGPRVQYAPNGQVATYVVSGTTLGVHIQLL